MKRWNTTRFRATYSREVTSRACDPWSCPRRNLFTPVFTRPDRLTLVKTLVSAQLAIFFLFCFLFFLFFIFLFLFLFFCFFVSVLLFCFVLVFFLGRGGGGVFSFLLCKVGDSAKAEPRTKEKTVQLPHGCTKNPLANQASATFVRSGSINFNLFFF